MTYTRVYAIFSENLFETEIWRKAEEGGIGKVGKGAEVVDRTQSDLPAAKGIDSFCLLVTEVGMTLEGVGGTGVDVEPTNVIR